MDHVFARIGETRLPDGRRIIVTRLNNVKIGNPSNVARHESTHAYVASTRKTLQYVTIRPSGNALGHAALTTKDTVAAAASIAHGHDGTSHDEAIVRSDGDMSGPVSRAYKIMAGKKMHLRAIATALDDEQTLSASRVADIIATVDQGPVFLVRVIAPEGKTLQEKRATAQSDDSVISLSELPKAA